MNDILTWSGYKWQFCMEGGRLIHPDYPYMYYSDSCIMIQEYNILELSIQKKPKTIQHWNGNTYNPEIACGLIRSVDTFSHGIFSAEIMMPRGVKLWPSFWLCGVGPWPESGEIDIEEGYSKNTGYLRLFTPYFPWINPSWMTTNNIHYSKEGQHKQIRPRSVSIFKQRYNPDENFIKYECRWAPDKITILADGKVIREDEKAVKEFKSNQVNVIFNLFCEGKDSKIYSSMLIRKFDYKPLI